MEIQIKRIYEPPSPLDGYRVLIDRIWPRGVKKNGAKLDEWNKDIAPSTELRKWFGHILERFDEFSLRYQTELDSQKNDLLRLGNIAQKENLCLLYSARDPLHNQAIVLRNFLSKLTNG